VTDIAMPRLSDSMEQGTILSWLKAEGEQVDVGEDLVEIETDKATMTYQAEAAGTLALVAMPGDTLPVGAVIARVGDAPQPEPQPEPEPEPEPEPDAAAPEPPLAKSEEALGVSATPVARRVAAVQGVSLEGIVGTGPRGRITRRDVEARTGAVAAPAPTPALKPPASPPPSAASIKGTVEVVELTRLQQTVARRMAEVKATVPEFQVQTEVAMNEAIALRTQIRDSGVPAPSLNDFVVRAAALALREHPRANGSYRDGCFELYSRVNVGVAVAAPDALVVPTIFDADIKSLGTIAAEVRRAAERVRDGQITPPEMSGGTFTVSNLGMYGMTSIYPVISAPQAGILGVGATRPVLARHDGQIVEQQLMTLTLTCDHRILYGADAAAFLSAIKDLLERPLRVAV
jgi:pyruvate dehydrogenase E2 component (dihydrolipoamide acetyltransferase)